MQVHIHTRKTSLGDLTSPCLENPQAIKSMFEFCFLLKSLTARYCVRDQRLHHIFFFNYKITLLATSACGSGPFSFLLFSIFDTCIQFHYSIFLVSLLLIYPVFMVLYSGFYNFVCFLFISFYSVMIILASDLQNKSMCIFNV